MMKLCDLNPHIRHAGYQEYKSNDNPVKVTDCRIFYILSGEAEIFINNQTFQMKQNSMFYCCGGSEYNIVSPKNIEIISLNFDLTQEKNEYISVFMPESKKNNIVDMPVFYNEIEDSPFLSKCIYIENAFEFLHKLKKIVSEFSDAKVYFREICSSVLKEILISIHRPSYQKKNILDDIIFYIQENFKNPITNKELARMTGYHEYYLNKLFLKYTGKSIHNYILTVRINHAKKLILNTELALYEIAEQCGFNDCAYFSAYFKKTVGITPLNFRKNLQNKV